MTMQVRRNANAPLFVIVIMAFAWMGVGLIVTNSYYQLMLTLVPIWAVMGLSWNLLSGYTGLVSFGHASFFGLGAYTVTLALVHYDITPWLGIPLGMVVGTLAGVVIGYPTFRLRGHYFALSMLAYPMALLYVFQWLGYQEVPLPMKRQTPGFYMQFSDYRVYIALAVALLVAALLISLKVERSRFGLSLVAIKQNEPAAEAAGIDTLAWKMRAIMLSGAKIGRNCLVGAGALITEGKEFPDNSLVMGSPARALRTVDKKTSEMILEGADIYVRRWKQYAKGLKRTA